MSAGRADDADRSLPTTLQGHLSESHAVLWTVIAVSSVFDIVTTMVGIERGLGEGNAVARAFIETYGTPGIGLLKFVALVGVAVLWVVLPERYATALLAGFALVSVVVVGLNALTLTGL